MNHIGDSSLSPTLDRPFSFRVFENRTPRHAKSKDLVKNKKILNFDRYATMW